MCFVSVIFLWLVCEVYSINSVLPSDGWYPLLILFNGLTVVKTTNDSRTILVDTQNQFFLKTSPFPGEVVNTYVQVGLNRKVFDEFQTFTWIITTVFWVHEICGSMNGCCRITLKIEVRNIYLFYVRQSIVSCYTFVCKEWCFLA